MTRTPERYLAATIRNDALAAGKMAFISGPRQVGKTTLAKGLLASPQNYQSWDDNDFRKAWSRSPRAALGSRGPGPVVLDEIGSHQAMREVVVVVPAPRYWPKRPTPTSCTI